MQVVRRMRLFLASLVVVAAALAPAGQAPPLQALPPAVSPAATPAGAARVFDFGPGPVAPGATQVLATTAYTPAGGFGFLDTSVIACHDRGTADPAARDFCTGSAPFRFVVDLPEGNYRVTVTLGDAGGESLTTVRSESRRLMLSAWRPPEARW